MEEGKSARPGADLSGGAGARKPPGRPAGPPRRATDSSTAPGAGRRRRRRRLVILVAVIVFLIFLMRDVLFPFRDQLYQEIPHGDHTHYLPKDRDPSVPIGQFPTRRPSADERITARGEIVPK